MTQRTNKRSCWNPFPIHGFLPLSLHSLFHQVPSTPRPPPSSTSTLDTAITYLVPVGLMHRTIDQLHTLVASRMAEGVCKPASSISLTLSISLLLPPFLSFSLFLSLSAYLYFTLLIATWDIDIYTGSIPSEAQIQTRFYLYLFLYTPIPFHIL